MKFAYARTGQLALAQQYNGTWTRNWTYSYTSRLEPEFEVLPDFLGDRRIARTYADNAVGRPDSVVVEPAAGGTDEYLSTFEYDGATSRMSRVTGPGLPTGGSVNGAYYSYVTNSDFVGQIDIKDNGTVKTRTTRQYETSRDLLDYVENRYAPGGANTLISKYDYTNDDLGRRTTVAHSGSAFSSSFSLVHGYNDRNELTSTTKGGSNWRAYVYDPIGNRTSATEYGSPNLTTEYTANALNQYAHADTNGNPATGQGYRYDEDGNLTELFVAGDMNCDNALDNSDIDAFTLALTDPEEYATTYPGCNILNGDLNGDGSLDNSDIDAFTDLLISYSHDGTQVVNAALTWDAENRLIGWEALPPRTANSHQLKFEYDWMGRRIGKESKVWNKNTSSWDAESDTKYVWDGWLLLEELDAGGSGYPPVRKYTWGLDLSGLSGAINDRTSAGGIGGLLAMYKVTGSTGYAYFCDGNGNVGQVVKPSDGTIAVRYKYDAYGQRTNAAVGGELEQAFRFSTKQLDTESGLYYNDNRYYIARSGRWANHDPLGARGGNNLYLYAGDDPINVSDPFGLAPMVGTGLEWSPISSPQPPATSPATQSSSQPATSSAPCTSCCCADSVTWSHGKDWELLNKPQTAMKHIFNVQLNMTYRSDTVSGDCRLEWQEWSNIDLRGPHGQQTHKANEWTDFSNADPETFPALKVWKTFLADKHVCDKQYTATLPDEAYYKNEGTDGIKELKIVVRLHSAKDCNCKYKSVYLELKQTLVFGKDGKIIFEKSSLKEVGREPKPGP